MRGGLVALVAPVATLVLAACYETPTPACAFACGRDGDCPGGYSCRSDRWCKRDDIADQFACVPSVPDASAVSGDPAQAADGPAADAEGQDAAPQEAARPDAVLFDGSTLAMPASPFPSLTGT